MAPAPSRATFTSARLPTGTLACKSTLPDNIALPAAALSTPQPSASAQFKVNAPVGAADMVAVSAQFTMGGEKANNPFDIRIAFSPASYDGAVGNYQVVLTIPASCLYDETGTTLQKVTWKDAMITKTERTKVDG